MEWQYYHIIEFWCLGTLCSKYAHWNYGSKISFVVLAARYFQRLSVEPWSTFTWPPQVMGLLPTKFDPLFLPCWFLRSSHRNLSVVATRLKTNCFLDMCLDVHEDITESEYKFWITFSSMKYDGIFSSVGTLFLNILWQNSFLLHSNGKIKSYIFQCFVNFLVLKNVTKEKSSIIWF